MVSEEQQFTMKTEDLAFIGSDPGAVKHGNFINYYSFHSPTQRIQNLHSKMFPIAVDNLVLCLDIGCNTGDLSWELHLYLTTLYPDSTIHILAIDIDPSLIQRAVENNTNTNITFVTADIMTKSDQQVITKYLNLHQKKSFDISFCFSVTMWIHLNNGDEGLQNFLNFIKEISKTIIIEPQPWNCYRNAQRRLKKSGSSFPLYTTLQIRSNVDSEIEKTLTENLHRKVYESSTSAWNRKVQSYQQLL